jgi:hypothetical protein
MSVDVNVYTATDPLPIEQILAGVQARGVEAEFERDTFNIDESFQAGKFTAPDGDAVEISFQDLFVGEKEDLYDRAQALSEGAGRLAPELRNSYRLVASSRGPLLWAVVDTIAELTPSLILDTDSDTLYVRAACRSAFSGAPED